MGFINSLIINLNKKGCLFMNIDKLNLEKTLYYANKLANDSKKIDIENMSMVHYAMFLRRKGEMNISLKECLFVSKMIFTLLGKE